MGKNRASAFYNPGPYLTDLTCTTERSTSLGTRLPKGPKKLPKPHLKNLIIMMPSLCSPAVLLLSY